MAEYDYFISGGGHEARGVKPTDPSLPKVGYGGHPVGARPKRKALTVYQGRQPFTLEVPMILWNDGASVEGDRIALDNMATTEAELLTQAPPVVQIKASYTLPIPPALGTENTAKWWIEDLAWGEEFRKAPDEGGYLTFKVVTVTLLEWSEDYLLGGGSRNWRYRVRKPPDTLFSIAARCNVPVSTIQRLNPKLRSAGSLKNGMIIHTPEPLEGPKVKPGPKAPLRKAHKPKRRK
ncbi:MAG: LysM peptidoglycan-binding domain-containing protein [Solirubrobacteraceae bacterium]